MDDLKAKLAVQEAELKQKNENADKLIQVVGVETEKVSKEKAIADEEEIKVEVINKVGLVRLPLRAQDSGWDICTRTNCPTQSTPGKKAIPYCRLDSKKRIRRECPRQPRSSQRKVLHCSISIAAQPDPNTSLDWSLALLRCSGFGGAED